jgi:hypothetical protein
MHLNARLYPHSDSSREALLAAIHPDDGDPVSARYAVRVGTEALRRALADGDAADGFGVSGELILDKQELRSLSWFEPLCRKVANETDADYQKNFDVCQRTPLRNAGAEESIRLMRNFSLSRITIKPNYVAGIGEWTGEYILGKAARAAFEVEQLSGWTAAQIFHTKTGVEHEHFSQLYCESVLPPSVRDVSIETISSRVDAEHGKLRRLGCVAYSTADLDGRPDFNRTAEPWQGWHGWPAWVVSRRVKDAFETHGLRGWRFRPVFIAGTELYRQYVDAWTELSAAVRATTKSKLDGGQW